MRSTMHRLAALLAPAASLVLGSPAGGLSDFLHSINVKRAALPAALDGRADAGCSSACSILTAGFPDRLMTAAGNVSIYTQQADAYWSASAWTSPSCIFTPVTTEELSAAVLTAQRTQCQFAVRSGGHSPFHGFAGIDQGLLISTAGFTDLEYSNATQIQRSGMGNRWGDVYKYLIGTGRLVVGGRLNDVGLALSAGGGLSHFSNLHGWVSQNIVSYEVMLANGSHVVVDYRENPDLFRAVSVGNNNFGIITHINQQTFPMGKVWGGTVLYSGDQAKDFMSAMADFQLEGQLDGKAAILPYVALTNDTIFATMVYLDPTEKPKAFEAFYRIGNVSDFTQVHDSFHDLAGAGLPSLPRWSYSATTTLFDKTTYLGIIDVLATFNNTMQNIQGGTVALMTQPISESMVVESNRRPGGDPLGVKQAMQLWMGVTVGWSNSADDATVNQILLNCTDAIEAYTKQRGYYDPFVFVNDAFSGQKPLQSFGAANYANMKAASAKYDPQGVFQKLVPGGFKLDD